VLKKAVLPLAVALIAGGCPEPVGRIVPEPDTKVAFIADQGYGPGARAVLRLIKAEKAVMVLHQGDFDYSDDPDRFDKLITDILGEDFPYFASLGNHEADEWQGYQAKLRARLGRIKGAQCEGDLAIMAACTYRGLFFVLSAVGLWEFGSPAEHAAYIEDQLAQSEYTWRICSWHKTQWALQVGDKEDETGWGVYEACRKGGAIIATGHDHSYARTHLIREFKDVPEIASKADTLEIEKGQTVAFVSGLGGRSIRPQEADGDWWASIYTRTQDAEFGALFCTFGPGGQADRAHCYFKAVSGEVPDRFVLTSKVGK
jgi:hypothetical protein